MHTETKKFFPWSFVAIQNSSESQCAGSLVQYFPRSFHQCKMQPSGSLFSRLNFYQCIISSVNRAKDWEIRTFTKTYQTKALTYRKGFHISCKIIVSLKFSPHEIQIWNKIKQLHNDPFQLLRKKKKQALYIQKSPTDCLIQIINC